MEPTNKGPKACTTCAKAKARCIPGPERNSKCERCQRLNKECVSQRPAPPRAKKAPKRSRVAELEKRLDELSSQFVDGVVAVNPRPKPSTGPGSRRERTKCDNIVTFEYLFPSPRSESAEASGWSSEAGSNDCVAAERLWPDPAEAEALLFAYHETHAPLAPFVVVPKHLTAAELHRQRPFLWRVVMMVGCFSDGPRHHRLGKEVLAELGRLVVMDGSKSLELLQGLLLIISWQNFALRSAQLTNLLFLARSMSLTAASPGTPFCGANCNKGEIKWGELEYARAYVGTYYVNAIVFNTNKKADAFMNTSQLDAFCNLLTSPGEYPSDIYLAKLVKIQMLSQSISMAMTFDPAQQQPMQLPLTMVVQTFQEQIDAYRASLPPHLVDNGNHQHSNTLAGTLQCHLAISEILLSDISISDPHCSSVALPHADRIQLLWSCLRSLRRFYTVHAAVKCCDISDKEQRSFLGLNASDLAYTIITGIKLLLVRLPGWDPRYIVSELWIREMLDKEIEDVGAVVARRESDRWMEEDPLGRMHKLLKYGRDLIEFQLQKLKLEMDVSSSSDSTLSTPSMVNKGEGGQGWVMMGIEDLDDDLWQSFMNDTAWGLNGEPMVMDAF
ncbi:uncharacterized protein TRIVIDRAFT_41147 [Trichoderma virens Gv29-8]|uniref:Zn(2)-C6 fungal-type domain-containing protein n=1 Tax=Hypocrea virens (strain Gv29-8 / FGSC 10586) TaxID=413071 RepID=G9N9R7_HYPVG|nr:uncharacterized protein TRIVIDRAFT_41147 [Trichoderma virens Gv29-8]EHK16685.1 hypothetical protein TRIVIDRAFT_41147 [Trichoderma virens Gv29-8]UKZ51935.1 hypothetical protein TrVGV298_005702 [Trichoderma virens]